MTSEVLQLLISGISQGCVYGLIALGFVLIYKATEMVNFAQGDIMMFGAFVAYTFLDILDWPLSSSACSCDG
jgi:branched-chain amino acid transport system permease protein